MSKARALLEMERLNMILTYPRQTKFFYHLMKDKQIQLKDGHKTSPKKLKGKIL